MILYITLLLAILFPSSKQDVYKIWLSPSIDLGGLSFDAVKNAVEYSAKVWLQDDIEFVEFRNNADIRIESIELEEDDLRVAYFDRSSKTIRLNRNFNFYIRHPAQGKLSLILVLVHEFGHSFNINHDNNSLIMKPKIRSYPFDHWDITKSLEDNGFTNYERRLFSPN